MLARLESGKTWLRDRIWKGIKTVLARRRYRVLALLLGLAFFLLYLFSIQHIAYLPNVDFSYQASIPSVKLVSNWTARVFKTRVPFIWEPIKITWNNVNG